MVVATKSGSLSVNIGQAYVHVRPFNFGHSVICSRTKYLGRGRSRSVHGQNLKKS